MPDENSIHSPVPVKLFFKRKNYQRLIDVVTQQPHPPLPPRPKLRRNVVDHGNAALLHLPRHPPVKRGRVDDDGEIGLAPLSLGDQMPVQPVDLRQVAENLSDAYHREVFRIDNRIAASSAHALPTDTEEFELRSLCGDSRPRLSSGAKLRSLSRGSPLESFDKLRAIHFSRSLAG